MGVSLSVSNLLVTLSLPLLVNPTPRFQDASGLLHSSFKPALLSRLLPFELYRRVKHTQHYGGYSGTAYFVYT